MDSSDVIFEPVTREQDNLKKKGEGTFDYCYKRPSHPRILEGKKIAHFRTYEGGNFLKE